MKQLKAIGTALLVIIFPLGVLFCVIHTLGKDFGTFIGSLAICGIGILIGIYIVEPQLIMTWLEQLVEWLQFIKI